LSKRLFFCYNPNRAAFRRPLREAEDMSRKLSVRELAELLNVAEDTIRGWAAAGTIPALRACPRGAWRFDADEVLDALRRAGRGAGKAAGPITAA
jgi:excisionase family DNA binding protein